MLFLWNQNSFLIWASFYSPLLMVQFSSVAQSCPTLCDPMNSSTPGLPVHHQLLEFTQTHVHRVGDAIQPSHPLSSPSPPAPNPSQHQSLFQWVITPPQKTSYPLAIILHSPFSLNPSNTNFFLLSSWVSLFWIFHINHIIYSLCYHLLSF